MFAHVTRWLALLAGWVGLACLPAMAGGNPNQKFSISFHLETDANENPKMVFPQVVGGKTKSFRRLPEISSKDIQAFRPFPAQGDEGFGVILQLKEPAQRRWSATTNLNVNRWIVSQINGRVVDGFVVDRQVDDGMVIIWKGVTEADFALLDKEFPRIGAPKK